MEESNGFFLMHRKILHSSVFDDPITLKVWVWCLARANYKERTIIFNKQPITLKPGQFVTGRYKAVQELDIGVTEYRNRIKLLQKLNKIEVKSTKLFSLITVVNWGYYQHGFKKATIRRPSDDHQTTTDNNINKETNIPEQSSVNPKNMSFNKYSDDYEEGEVSYETGELVEPKKKDNHPSRKRMDELVDWLIDYQGRDKLKTNRTKQFKALKELVRMKVTGQEAQDIIKEQMQSDYWKKANALPDFSTVVALIQKRGK